MRVPMSIDDFHRLPRHPDWRHEYWDGALQLSYRPRVIHLRRENRLPVPGTGRHVVRLVDPLADRPRLDVFLTALWSDEDPCRTFDDATAADWLAAGLEASFERLTGPGGAIAEEDGEIIGAALTERPYGDDDSQASHLSWLSVRWGWRCTGVGTDLLATLVDALRTAGVEDLNSSVSPGNVASLAWHWRAGFQAVPDPVARFRKGARHP